MNNTIEKLHSVAKELQANKSPDETLIEESFAAEMDKRDPLASMRSEFHMPTYDDNGVKKEHLYFTGNSLGLQPKETQKVLDEEMEAWRNRGVEGHFTGERPWLTTDDYVLDEVCKLVGAQKEEVAVMNSLTVNLHLLMISFYKPSKEKFKIMIESDAFPSDWYAVESQAQLHGFDVSDAVIRLKPRDGEATVREEDIEARLEAENGSVALILWPGVQYYTGQLFDMKRIVAAGHKHGANVGLDLAHAVGNVALSLHDWNVDFAAWCHYKYVNSGPGAIGGAFVHERHVTQSPPPHRLAGWWGHELKTRFGMRTPFTPIAGAYGWRLSNPPVVAVACVLGSLRVFSKVPGGFEALQEKSRLLTGYFAQLLKFHVQERFESGTLEFLTPLEEEKRGCQLSLVFGGAVKPREVFKRLEAAGVITDFREPDSIRAAPVPLYNSFEDVRKFVAIVVQTLEDDNVPKRK